jgi:HSP20 family molecular chaperone IbpA
MDNNTQVVERAPQQDRAAKAREPALLPPIDVIEDGNGILLVADMPGVSKEQLHLRIDSDTLTIEGEVSLPGPQGVQAGHAEVQLARYRRSFTLSKELDPEQISATLVHGVLEVRIPKAAHAQPRRIEVNVA